MPRAPVDRSDVEALAKRLAKRVGGEVMTIPAMGEKVHVVPPGAKFWAEPRAEFGIKWRWPRSRTSLGGDTLELSFGGPGIDYLFMSTTSRPVGDDWQSPEELMAAFDRAVLAQAPKVARRVQAGVRRAACPILVARAKLAGADTINRFIEADWLPKVGQEIVRRVGGSSRVDLKKGYIVMVTTATPDVVEVIGIRVSTYRSEVTLHHVLGGDAEVTDEKELAEVMKMTATQVADWAVDSTRGRAQTDLFLDSKERNTRLWDQAREIASADPKFRSMTWNNKQKHLKGIVDELLAGRR